MERPTGKSAEHVSALSPGERPLIEKLWSRWEKLLLIATGVSFAASFTLAHIAIGGQSRIVYPEIMQTSDSILPIAVGFGLAYLGSRFIRWTASGLIETFTNMHKGYDSTSSYHQTK